MPMTVLHPRLEADTRSLGETPDFWLRWMNDCRFPWVIVVPRLPDVQEWYQLDTPLANNLLDQVNRCALHLQMLTRADKINIGALGNQVPQLHVHVIARRTDDPCWPGPVWGQGEPIAYDGEPDWVRQLRERLSYRCG